jgi:hypothetical protein
MKTVKVAIGMASLADIAETACKAYRKELAEAVGMIDVEYIFESLADVIKLWDTVHTFDCDDELILTIERREEKEDGTDHAD